MALVNDVLDRPAGDGAPVQADPRRWKALGVLALVQFMIVIDITVVNVALPSIQKALHFTGSGLAWVVDGYALMAGGLLMLGGRAGDLFGRRRLFLIGTTLFAVASLTSGLAQARGMLIASRFAQGAGEALASPAALALVVLLFDEAKERTRALALWGALAGLGGTVGVVLSGVITDLIDWRWIFFINLPFAALALALIPRLVDESKAERPGRGRIDVAGAVLVTGGVLALVDGFLQAARHSWGSPTVVWPLALGIAALIAFVVVELRVAEPLIPMTFFRNRTRVSANVATAVMASGMFGMFFLLTLYLQSVLGYSPMRTGITYLPFGFGIIAGAGLSTALVERLGARRVLTPAFILVGLGMLWLARIDPHATFAGSLLPSILMISIGMGAAFPALQLAALHQVSEQDAGLGSGLQNTVMQVGGSLGLAILVTVALRRTGSAISSGVAAPLAATNGYTLAFKVAAGALFAAAALAAALVPGKEKEETLDDELRTLTTAFDFDGEE